MLEKKNQEQEGDNLIRISSKGDFNNTFRFLKRMNEFKVEKILEKYHEINREIGFMEYQLGKVEREIEKTYGADAPPQGHGLFPSVYDCRWHATSS